MKCYVSLRLYTEFIFVCVVWCSLWAFSIRTCSDYCFKHRSAGSPTFAYLSSPSHEVSSHDVRLQPGPSPCFCLFDEGAFMWAVPFSCSKIIWHLGICLIVFIFSYVQCLLLSFPLFRMCWFCVGVRDKTKAKDFRLA